MNTSDIRLFKQLVVSARKNSMSARKAARKAIAAGKVELAAMYARNADFWTRRLSERRETVAALKAEAAS